MTSTRFPATARPFLPKENCMSQSAKVPLDPDEDRVTRAQHLLIQLGAALVSRPFDTRTHDRLRAFLTDDAAEVLTSLQTLEKRPELELRRRIAELTGNTPLRNGGSA